MVLTRTVEPLLMIIKSEGKRTFGEHRRKLEDNIKADII
jgi:hypothetical protein